MANRKQRRKNLAFMPRAARVKFLATKRIKLLGLIRKVTATVPATPAPPDTMRADDYLFRAGDASGFSEDV